MIPLPTQCPIDGGEIVVTRVYCPSCDVTLEGRFAVEQPFASLNAEQLDFVETFVRCEGKINRVEEELSLSYPTIRNRLREVIRALGYEPDANEEAESTATLSENERSEVLAQLERGEIEFDQAMQILQTK